MTRHLDDEADFVIVGTGAGGATAARVLSGAGLDVLMLEEGRYLKTAERPRDQLGAMAMAFRDCGTAMTEGTVPMPLLQGRCVGGATAINSGIIWRMPDDVRATWIAEHGLASLVNEDLDRAYDHIERELEIAETPAHLWGGNAELMAEASERLGLPGKPITRNASRCKGTAQCLQGCPGEARQSMDVSYVPRSMRAGARLETGMRVDRVITEWGRAVGVEGSRVDPVTRAVIGTFRVMARRGVIVSASAIQTPVILRRSGFRGLVGERFQAHPGAAMVGRFDDPVAMAYGGTQAYEVPLRARRMKLETLSLPPEMLAARLPGAGAAWQRQITELDHFAQWCVLLRSEAHGRIRPSWRGGGSSASTWFTMTQRDVNSLQEGLALLARMMFAVGAKEVFPGIGGMPSVLRTLDEVDAFERAPMRLSQVTLMCSHLFGTACAGADPRRSVVSPDLAVHGVTGLHVMDASVFPTNMGVNPQHTIMALTWVAAERLANREQRSAAA